MSSQYPILDNRPIDQWKVTELRDELKRRKLTTKGLKKDDLVKLLDEAIHSEQESTQGNTGTSLESAHDSTNESGQETTDLFHDNKEKDASIACDSIGDNLESEVCKVDVGGNRTPSVSANDTAVEYGQERTNLFDANKENDASITSDPIGDKLEGEGCKVDVGGNKTPSVYAHDSTVESGHERNQLLDANKETDASVTCDLVFDKMESEASKIDVSGNRTPSNSGNDPAFESGHERTQLFDTNKENDASVACESISDEMESEVCKVDVSDNKTPSDGGKVVEGEPFHSIGIEVRLLNNVETNNVVAEAVDSVMALDGHDLENQGTQGAGNSKAELQNPCSRSSDVDAKIVSPKPNEVSEVSSVLVSHVNTDSVSTDISISEKVEVMNNVITDVKLEVDVKHELVHLSSSNIVPGSESCPMDAEETHDNSLSVGKGSTEKINDLRDSGSSGELHIGQKSGDDPMDESVSENKQIDPKLGTDKNEDSVETTNGKVVGPDNVRNHITAYGKVDSIENKGELDVQSVKRKTQGDEAVINKAAVKRQRRWNSESIEIPQNQSGTIVASTTPKDASRLTFKHSLSVSNSMASEESPKERVVPPSQKPATNSLRIDRFLRPFTLKAVQELLGKTGTVTSFWMDNIKTHCYVSYSTVEEATDTRNALYNLQWPTNGGRLLVAEFVDPLEVKVHVEGPPQPPVTPVSTGSTVSAAPPIMQAQPSLRQQIQRKQLQPLPPPPPPPILPPPPPLFNPPPVREQFHLPPPPPLPLPPPPPLPQKADLPIVTLDDLFRKTKTTPRIYYLPLSDEQVEAKLKAQGKDTKQ